MAAHRKKRPQWKAKPVPVARPAHLEKGTGRDLMTRRAKKKRFEPPHAKVRRVGPRLDWSKEQDQIIRKNYTKHGSVYTAALLGRSMESVQHRALRLGVPGHGIRTWTKKEVAFLRLQYPKLPVSKICRILKRTEQSVRGKIHLLRLGGVPSRPWTQDEISYLRKHYGKVPVAELSQEFGRTRDAVELKAGKLGLSKKNSKFTKADERYIIANLGKESFTVMASKRGTSLHYVMKVAEQNGYRDRPTSRSWTDADDERLRRLYGTMSNSDVAERLQRTELAVVIRARSMGLRSTFRVKRPRAPYNPWTKAEDAQLRRLYRRHTAKEIGLKIGRSEASITSRVTKLGLRK